MAFFDTVRFLWGNRSQVLSRFIFRQLPPIRERDRLSTAGRRVACHDHDAGRRVDNLPDQIVLHSSISSENSSEVGVSEVRTLDRTNFYPCRHETGHHIPHAQGAGTTPYGRAPSRTTVTSEGNPLTVRARQTFKRCCRSTLAVQVAATFFTGGLRVAPRGISPNSR